MFKGINFLIKFCWKFSKKFIIFQFLSSICFAITPLIAIVVPKYIIDELMGQKRIDILIGLALTLIISLLLGNSLSELLKTKAFINKNIAFQKMQLYLTENLFDADYESIESPEFLDLKEKAKKFLYGNGRGFASVFDDFSSSIASILKFLGIIVIICTLNVWIVAILIILVLISSFFDSIYSKIMYKIDMDKTPIERRTAYFMNLTDDFQYGKEVRIYNLKSWLLKKYSEVLNASHEFYKKSYNKTLNNSLLKHLSTFFEQGIMYIYLIISVVNNSIGIGDFTMYIGAISSFSESMKTLMNNFININQYENYYKELEMFLNMPKTMRESKNIKINDNISNYKIEFKNVSFKYKGQNNYTLKNISLIINPKERISIVGENGAGKTTLIKLLLRLYDPTEGNIYLNGINIKDIDYDEYLKIFSVVFQDFKIFASTIKENISFDLNSDNKTILECLEKSGLSEKVNNLENNMNTQVFKIFDENGIEFSGGQAQKLALSRAIFKNSGFVILDEPTAALDPRAEYELFSNFNRLAENKTVIYISHRLSSSKFSDKILVLKSGEVIEFDTHSNLIEKGGLYSELFNMQANNYIELSTKTIW